MVENSMSTFESHPDTELHDEPDARASADLERNSVSPLLFQKILDESLNHAASPSRRDANAAALPWRPLGPRNVGGRIRTIVQDRANPEILYAGSARGGLWKTTNGGDSWFPLDDFHPPNPPDTIRQALPIGALGVGCSNPEVLYVGTGEPILSKTDFDYELSGAGLYWSVNGGQTLTRLDHPDMGVGIVASRNFERILVDPWEPRRLWVASPTRGLWRGSPHGVFPDPPTFVHDVVDDTDAPAAVNQKASDVVINFGSPMGVPPTKFTVYVGLRGFGIYKATFDRGNNSYDLGTDGKAWTKLVSSKFPDADSDLQKREFHRIKLALCERYPQYIFAIFALKNEHASNVFFSSDGGQNWQKTDDRPRDEGDQAWYDLVLEVHPQDPRVIFTGSVDMFRTFDGGKHWVKVIDGRNYDKDDRAQHADQHACVFDAVDSLKVWVGNDGGISMSENLGLSWRKRSHGIVAAQFTDISVHPDYPFISGGGLQDNGTWITYGGTTWYHLYGGDGGDIGFEPADPRAFHVTTQNGIRQARVQKSDDFDWLYSNPLPDIGKGESMRTEILEEASGFSGSHKPTFYSILEHHPNTPNEALAGRYKAAYRTEDGHHFHKLDVGTMQEFRPAGDNSDFFIPQVSALAYTAGDPNQVWWVGTSRGELFRTTDGGNSWQEVAPAAANGKWIAQIAVHPVSPEIVAFASASNPGLVFLSGDQGSNWIEISGTSPNAHANEANRLNLSPALALVFDPATPNPAAGPYTLYVGTLTGVYVIRNAIAPVSPLPTPTTVLFSPIWRTLNVGLPLLQISDLTSVQYTLPGGIIKRLLRAATFGRGIYECELDGAPSVRLLIRSHVCDDGKSYQPSTKLTDDPRMPPGRLLATQQYQSLDIRLDAPPFRDFGRVLDGAEMDEQFVSDTTLIAGELNLIYVQLYNSGARDAHPVDLYLFYADTVGDPAQAPDLPANFWAGFPAAITPWHLAGSDTVSHLDPANPQVICLQWQIPPDVGKEIALLAICTHAADHLVTHQPDGSNRPAANPQPPLVVDPRKPNSLVEQDRRTALRITTVETYNPDPFCRDGTDDLGLGAIAWGGRSPDIVVLEASVAATLGDLNIALADLSDCRPDDRLKGTDNHQIYVRVHNRRKLPVANIKVRFFGIQLDNIHKPTSWVSLGNVDIANIDAEKWLFTPPVEWNKPPDPSPNSSYKVWLIAAIIGMTDPAGPDDESPDHTAISTVQEFWRFFLEGGRNNNATLKGIRWVS